MQSIMSDPELIKEFLTETNEMLENLDNDLVSLENDPQNSELLNSIFRAVHTIKGTSSFLGYEQLVELGHASEDVLHLLRDGKRIVTSEVMDVLLESNDNIKELVRQIEADKIEKLDLNDLIQRLGLIKQGEMGSKDAEASSGTNSGNENSEKSKKAKARPDKDQQDDKGAGRLDTGTIRVDVGRLDDLMNLIGELVLERNRLLQINREMRIREEQSDFIDKIGETTERIHFVTNELQLSVLKTRMTPIDRLFKKFPRLVRDIAREMNKEVDLILSGGETELDKTVLDELGDPLVHLMRNSVDHGLEPTDVRVAKGKPRTGKVHLTALQEGNYIVISIKDDGQGLDVEKIKKKAIEREIISAQQAQSMSRQDLMQLIFEPGFSTADTVSNLSGRGVGMDVVRTNIRKLNGIIDLQSEQDIGTEVILKLPLTLAIMQSLMVRVINDVFAIPLASVIETFRIDKKDIKQIDKRDVICHRESVIPLFYLKDLLNMKDYGENGKNIKHNQYVVLIGIAEKRYGLVVDRLLGQEEIVIKSLGDFLGNIPGIAGGTITGDGRVRLIIDCGSIAEMG